jgi:hypothetical protein
LLAEALAEFLREQAGGRVGRGARAEADHDARRMVGIIIGACRADRSGGECERDCSHPNDTAHCGGSPWVPGLNAGLVGSAL